MSSERYRPRRETRRLGRARRLIRRQQTVRAAKGLKRLLVARPDLAAGWFELARLDETTAPARAIAHHRRAVWLNPRLAEGWYRLGGLYEQQALFFESIRCFWHYIRLRPHQVSSELYLRLAHALSRLRYEGSAVQFYLKALESDQQNPLLFFSLAQTVQKLGDLDLALESMMALGRLYPAKLDLVSLLMGHILEKQGEAEAARRCYDEALSRQPRQLLWRLKRDLVYPLVPENAERIEADTAAIEQALSSTLERLRHQPVQLPQEHFFYLAMMHGNIAYTAYHHTPQLRQRRLLAELLGKVLRRPPAFVPAAKADGQRIHLGIMVAAKSLSLGFIYAGAMADRLDPERFQVTVFCQSPDVAQLFKAGNRYRFRGPHVSWKVFADEIHEALAQIRASQLDAMFFTEPGWDLYQYLLAMYRVAPVQCTSWMNPGSSGIPAMDYFLSAAAMELPGADADYSESLERWSHFPSWVPGFEFPAPCPRADFGLAEDWHVYACLQNLLKFHPDFDLLVAEVLRRDPKGHLVMVSTPERQHLSEKLMQRFAARIPDVMDRIWIFPELSNQEFLQLLLNCDLALDPLHYGGGTTTYQALAAGLPIVTLPGRFMVGRITAALCRAMGYTEGIVADQAAYVETAVALANDPARRAEIGQRLRANRHKIYEDEASVTCFAEFLERSVARARGC